MEASGTWTYRQLATAVSDAQRWLVDSGYDRATGSCSCARTAALFVAILLALASLDAWPVLVNARLSAREIDEIRDHCGARRMIYTTSVSPHAREHAKRHGAVIQDVAGLGPVAIGPLNENVEPESIDTELRNAWPRLIYTPARPDFLRASC